MSSTPKTLRRTSRLPETRTSTISTTSTTSSSSSASSTNKHSSPLAPAPLSVCKNEPMSARVIRDKKRLDIEEDMIRGKTRGGILEAAEQAAASMIPEYPGPPPRGPLPATPKGR